MASAWPQGGLQPLSPNTLSCLELPCEIVISRGLVAQAVGLLAGWSSCKGLQSSGRRRRVCAEHPQPP